jgi:hypothetical protein
MGFAQKQKEININRNILYNKHTAGEIGIHERYLYRDYKDPIR